MLTRAAPPDSFAAAVPLALQALLAWSVEVRAWFPIDSPWRSGHAEQLRESACGQQLPRDLVQLVCENGVGMHSEEELWELAAVPPRARLAAAVPRRLRCPTCNLIGGHVMSGGKDIVGSRGGGGCASR